MLSNQYPVTSSQSSYRQAASGNGRNTTIPSTILWNSRGQLLGTGNWKLATSSLATRLRGFTLIEVLVALVVMGTAIAILAQGFTSGGGASGTAQNRTLAAWLAQAKMAELEAGILAINIGQRGTFDEPAGWRWEVSSEASSPNGLYKIAINITWKERNQDRTYTLVRLMRERSTEVGGASGK